MKYSRMFMFLVLMAAAAASFGAYNAAKPADNEYVADVPALVRENFRALKDDAIVNAGAVSGYSVGNASGNIPRSNGTLNTNLNSDLLDGYHASAFNASDALLLRLDGSRAMTGNIKFSGPYGILQDTSDGSDTGCTYVSGGGVFAASRGGCISLNGNEVTNFGGQISYRSGSVSTGHHIWTTNDTEKMRLTYSGYLGVGTPSPAVALDINKPNVSWGGQIRIQAPDYGQITFYNSGATSIGAENCYARIYANLSSGGLGITSDKNAPIDFLASQTQRMRLTGSGNLLIGTTTDDGTNKLQVNGGVSAASGFKMPNNAGLSTVTSTGDLRVLAYMSGANNVVLGSTAHPTILLSNGSILHNSDKIWTAGNDGAGSGLDADLLDGNSSAYFLPASSYTAADVLTKIKTVDGSGSGLDADTVDGYEPSTSDTNNSLVLRDSNGYIASSKFKQIVSSGPESSYGVISARCGTYYVGVTGAAIVGASNADSGKGVVGAGPSGGYDFYAYGSGTDYGTASSIRWKKNRKPIQNALGIVNKLDGLRFTWDKEHGGNAGVGFIAEEVGKYLPEIVVWDAKAPGFADGMDYSKMTPLLLQAIKELDRQRKSDTAALLRKIEKQEREIDELKSAIKAIQAKLH